MKQHIRGDGPGTSPDGWPRLVGLVNLATHSLTIASAVPSCPHLVIKAFPPAPRHDGRAIKDRCRPGRLLFYFLVLLFIAPRMIHGAGTITNATEASLDAALVGGGTVIFACDGTIVITTSKVVTNAMTLDATGHAIVLTATNAVTGGNLFRIISTGALTLQHLGLANASFSIASGQSSAVYNYGTLNAINCTFTNLQSYSPNLSNKGQPASGGAIYNYFPGIANLLNCTFAGNSALATAPTVIPSAGAPGMTGNTAAGGAIYNGGGTIDATNCTFYGNVATGSTGGPGGPPQSIFPGGTGGTGGAASGGAIFNTNNGTMALVNCTFASNSAVAGVGGASGGTGGHQGNGGTAAGGGVCLGSGTAYLINDTLAGGSSVPGTGGVINGNSLGGNLRNASGTFALWNTLVANSAAGTNASGTFTDNGNNLSSDGSCAFTATNSMNQTNALLGPLADNGGPTLTMALLPGSPAVDAGNNAIAAAADQRGFPRYGKACDIGAFELNPPQILSIAHLTNGHALLQCAGVIGPGYTVLTSTNLLSWNNATVIAGLTNKLFQFDDAGATNLHASYYRLRSP